MSPRLSTMVCHPSRSVTTTQQSAPKPRVMPRTSRSTSTATTTDPLRRSLLETAPRRKCPTTNGRHHSNYLEAACNRPSQRPTLARAGRLSPRHVVIGSPLVRSPYGAPRGAGVVTIPARFPAPNPDLRPRPTRVAPRLCRRVAVSDPVEGVHSRTDQVRTCEAYDEGARRRLGVRVVCPSVGLSDNDRQEQPGPGRDTGSPSWGRTSPLKRRKPDAGSAEPLHVGFHPTVRTAVDCFVPRPFGELVARRAAVLVRVTLHTPAQRSNYRVPFLASDFREICGSRDHRSIVEHARTGPLWCGGRSRR
ncbi:hypothetical protein DFR71_1775 [Nocardia alba]|uniref:Uncharacterized protein n=1 Tax=Nocardia alba TaxID=225051 RepID=A0A4R1G395_9NOCA|nr:hypothetical protein DFR71_1775 [Nocardia alba]